MPFDLTNATSIAQILSCSNAEQEALFQLAQTTRNQTIGNAVHLRGLIEISNICTKDCRYCGIRKSNGLVHRYQLGIEHIREAAQFAYTQKYGSVVLQGGERTDQQFVDFITQAIREIKRISNNTLGITLSLGEQDAAVYQEWFNAGAHRYLLRIETTNRELYAIIHPADERHSFEKRLACLAELKRIGYQVGTGVMIGLPFQEPIDLANDLLFFKDIDADMIGMGPYIEHRDTPLIRYKQELLPLETRFQRALNMVATLRLLMPTINIAATTALQTIHPHGREKALQIGANILMPNITPQCYRDEYRLYENKPHLNELSPLFLPHLEQQIKAIGGELLIDEWGDSAHYRIRQEEVHE